MSKPRFVYWKLNARAQMSMLMLHAGNIDYIWDSDSANTWPALKNELPFGQLPVIYHDNLIVAQSNVMTRYCAELCKLSPSDPHESLLANMLIEHCDDIFNLFAKAKYAGDEEDQTKAWLDVRDNKLPEKLEYLSRLLKGKTFFSDNHHMGDIAVFSTVYMANQAGLTDCLVLFPDLKRHYDKVFEIGDIKSFVDANHKPYFTSGLK